MTNEEAIKHLIAKLECLTRSKGFREKCDSYNSYEGCYECDLGYKQGNIGEQIESLKMAIEALKQEPCEDAISRKAVLEQTYNWSKDEFLRVTNPFYYLRKKINSLPSATPQPCEDCISREQAKVAIRDRFKDLPSRVEINTILNELPSVTSQPKTGHWQKISADKYSEHAAYYFRCSECGKDIIGEHNYCPNCGCRMSEGSE